MIIINTAGYLAEFMADAIIALPFCIAAGWLGWTINKAYRRAMK